MLRKQKKYNIFLYGANLSKSKWDISNQAPNRRRLNDYKVEPQAIGGRNGVPCNHAGGEII